MELSGIVAKGIGRAAVFVALVQSLDWIEHLVLKYVIETDIKGSGLTTVIVLLGVLIWTIGDLLDRPTIEVENTRIEIKGEVVE